MKRQQSQQSSPPEDMDAATGVTPTGNDLVKSNRFLKL